MYIMYCNLENFVVKKFSDSSKSMKIKHTKHFQRIYYVIERELNYRRVWKFLTRIFTHNYFLTRNFPNYSIYIYVYLIIYLFKVLAFLFLILMTWLFLNYAINICFGLASSYSIILSLLLIFLFLIFPIF